MGAPRQRGAIDHTQQRVRELLDQQDVRPQLSQRGVDLRAVTHIAAGDRDALRGEELVQQHLVEP